MASRSFLRGAMRSSCFLAISSRTLSAISESEAAKLGAAARAGGSLTTGAATAGGATGAGAAIGAGRAGGGRRPAALRQAAPWTAARRLSGRRLVTTVCAGAGAIMRIGALTGSAGAAAGSVRRRDDPRVGLLRLIVLPRRHRRAERVVASDGANMFEGRALLAGGRRRAIGAGMRSAMDVGLALRGGRAAMTSATAVPARMLKRT